MWNINYMIFANFDFLPSKILAEKANFAKYDRSRIDSLGVPYDYNSLMHFEKTAFSKNGQPTITPKKAEVSNIYL